MEIDKSGLNNIPKATENLRKIQEKIAPFIKRQKFKVYSTEGKWREGSR